MEGKGQFFKVNIVVCLVLARKISLSDSLFHLSVVLPLARRFVWGFNFFFRKQHFLSFSLGHNSQFGKGESLVMAELLKFYTMFNSPKGRLHCARFLYVTTADAAPYSFLGE